MDAFPQRLRALAARIRRPKPHGGPAPDAVVVNPSPAPGLAVPAAARPAPGAPRSFTTATPFAFTSPPTLHIGDTAIPVRALELDATWEPPRPEPGRTIIGIDGDVIVTGTLSTDGTLTIQSTTTIEQSRPPRPIRPPDGCPCGVIYSVCRCPDGR